MTVQPLPDQDGVRVLRADGELDATSVPPLLAVLPTLVAGAQGLVLDLSAVTFFDSAGVRLVDRLSRQSARVRAGFRVVAPTGTPARRVLELVGFAAVLAVEDLQTARAAVQP